jgi:YD repeat-containing protein
VYPDGSTVTYTWDTNKRLAKVQDVTGVTSYTYDPAGKLTKRTLPNGVSTYYEYDNANRLISIQHADSNDVLLLGFAYQFDAAGNRTQVTQTVLRRPSIHTTASTGLPG